MTHPIDIDRFLDELKKQRAELLADFEELNVRLSSLENHILMAEAVRDSYNRHFKLIPAARSKVDASLHQKFAPLSIREMLIKIAGEAGGILDVAQARTILVKAGVFKDERNAATSMAPILSRHEDSFRRVGRGIYVVTPTPAGERTERSVCAMPVAALAQREQEQTSVTGSGYLPLSSLAMGGLHSKTVGPHGGMLAFKGSNQ